MSYVFLNSNEFTQAIANHESHVADFNRAVQLFGEHVSRMARVLGMQAENTQRVMQGHSLAYTEEAFYRETQ